MFARRFTGQPPPVLFQDFFVYGRRSGNYPETGFETISLQLNDHTDRGVGGRQYGASEDIETLQSKNNASTSRFRAVEECGS